MRKALYLLGLIAVVAAADNTVVAKKTVSQILSVNQEERLTANIAVDYMNRLAMAGDKIVSIFGDEGTFVHQADDHTGQVFIKPTADNGTQPLAITIITENGVTQDLNLVPSTAKAATIILKSIANHKTPAALGLAHRDLNLQEQWIHIIKQAVLGELAVGSKIVPPRTVANFKLHHVKNYVTGGYVVEVWLIKNNTQKPLDVLEKTFFTPGDLAISLQTQSLEPGAKTYLYVVRVAHA
ncbi:MAG TPA: hypothetical protein DIC42_07220 [Holosporales bacterium]|nr:hypothetical protein [Holosporales bacterium]